MVFVEDQALNLLLLSPIAQDAVSALQASHHVLIGHDGALSRDALEDREVVIFRSGVVISAQLMGTMPKLQLVVRAGSGFDNIDLEYARGHGIRVVRVPRPSADAVAEFTFGLILAVARRIVEADGQIRSGSWPKHRLSGALLRNKTLGVVGVGNIGGRVGELGAAWGMRVLGCVARPDKRRCDALARRGVSLTDFDTVVAEADFLTVHCPLDETTRNLIDRRALAAMKPRSVLINTARGGVIDEAALREALVDRRLAGAALDVHETEGHGVVSPLAALPNVVLTPHIGGMAVEAQWAIGQRVIELIDAYASDRLDDEVEESELLA